MSTITPPSARRREGLIRGEQRAGEMQEHIQSLRSVSGGSERVSFDHFVDQHRHLFRDYVARRLHGTSHGGSAEDVLQDALTSIWTQFHRWPGDEKARLRFARRALRGAVVDTFRANLGRTGEKIRSIPTDPNALDGLIDDDDAFARAVGHAIAREAIGDRDYQGVIERGVLLAAIAVLDEDEKHALFLTAEGYDCAEIARQIGVSHQRARTLLMQARKLTRSLIEHAEAGRLSERERKRLWDLLDGKLSGRPKREAQRHLDNCAICQSAAAAERHLTGAGAAMLLPLPALPAIVAKLSGGAAHVGGGASAAASASSAGAGAGTVGASVGSTTLATSGAAGAWGGSLLAGATAKIGLTLAGLAFAGSVGGTWKAIHDRQHTAKPERPLVASVAKLAGPSTATRAEPVVATTRRTSTQERKAAKSSTPRRTRPRRTSSSKAVNAAARPARTRATRAPSSATATPPARPTSTQSTASSEPAGGEFVIGAR